MRPQLEAWEAGVGAGEIWRLGDSLLTGQLVGVAVSGGLRALHVAFPGHLSTWTGFGFLTAWLGPKGYNQLRIILLVIALPQKSCIMYFMHFIQQGVYKVPSSVEGR